MPYIFELEECVAEEYVTALPAKDEETIIRWNENPISFYDERYLIRKIELKHTNLLDSAIREWENSAARVFDLVDCTPETFDQTFMKLRNSLLLKKKTKELVRARQLGINLQGYVANISWSVLFANHLPQAVPTNRIKEICSIGRQIVGVFYLELLGKVVSTSHNSSSYATTFAKLDSLWQRAAVFGDNNDALLDPVLSISKYKDVCEKSAGLLEDPFY